MPLYNFAGKMVLFSHVPKAGGTSVELSLDQYNIGFLNRKFRGEFFPCSPQHFHKTMIDLIIDTNKIQYIFMTVRHPMSRIISEYRWNVEYFNLKENFNSWGMEMLLRYKNNNFINDNHFRPMVEFLHPNTEVFRLEDGLDVLFSRLRALFPTSNISQKVPIAMKSSNNISVIPSLEFGKMVKKIYAEDFEKFGYHEPLSICSTSY
jgi:hypothetical protein